MYIFFSIKSQVVSFSGKFRKWQHHDPHSHKTIVDWPPGESLDLGWGLSRPPHSNSHLDNRPGPGGKGNFLPGVKGLTGKVSRLWVLWAVGRSGWRKEMNPISRKYNSHRPKAKPQVHGPDRKTASQPSLDTVTRNQRQRNIGQEACTEPCHVSIVGMKMGNAEGGR